MDSRQDVLEGMMNWHSYRLVGIVAIAGLISASSPSWSQGADWKSYTARSTYYSCKVKLRDDLLADLPKGFPRSFSQYGEVRINFASGYSCDYNDPNRSNRKLANKTDLHTAKYPYSIIAFVQKDAEGGDQRIVYVRASWDKGQLVDPVQIGADGGGLAPATPFHGIGIYSLVDGRYVNKKSATAKLAGQQIFQIDEDREGFDVASMRATGKVLGVTLGGSLAEAIKSKSFVKKEVLYGKPCGKPVEVLDGLAGGRNVRVSAVDGKISEVTIYFRPSMKERVKDLIEIERRFGKPTASYGEFADTYAFYGSPIADDVKKHRVAPVTVFRKGYDATVQARFHDVPRQLKLLAHLSECRDKAALAVYGVAGEALKPYAKALVEELKKPQAPHSAQKDRAPAEATLERQKIAISGRFDLKADGKTTYLLFNGTRIGRTFEDKIFHSTALGEGWKIECFKGAAEGSADRRFAQTKAEAIATMQAICNLK